MAQRGKRARGASGSGIPQEDFDAYNFTSQITELNWSNFANKPIITGRKVNLPEKYHSRLNNFITNAGWNVMLVPPSKVYPKLVRYFYCNLSVDHTADTYTLVSRVKGVDIVLDVATLANYLECDVAQKWHYVTSDNDLAQLIEDIPAFYLSFTKNRTMPGGVTKNELKDHLRVLHLFICNNIAPKKGHLDAVSPLHCLILHSLVSGEYIDLNYLVLREMASVHHDSQKALPFGGILTTIFRKAGVSLQGEHSDKLSPSAITSYAFTRTGLDAEEQNAAQPDIGPQNEPQEPFHVPHMEQQPPFAPQMEQQHFGGDFSQQFFSRFDAMQASQNQLLAEFQNFSISQNSRFDRLEHRMDRVDHRMDHVDQAQQHYFDHYHQQYPDFVPYPPYHPPSPPQ
jgi:hypothetical protein